MCISANVGQTSVFTISLITRWTVCTEKLKPEVLTYREVYKKDRGIYNFHIDSPTSC